MKRVLVIPFLVGSLAVLHVLMLMARAAPSPGTGPVAVRSPNPRAPDEPFHSAPLTETLLPDLVVPFMKGEYENWNGRCSLPGQRYGLEVWIENVGEADAGPFVVEANEVQQTLESGLTAGERHSMWFPTYIHWDPNTAFADVTFLIEESNEDNNELSQRLPVPTAPLTCTPMPVQFYLPIVWR